jgi:ribosomal protein S4
MSRQFIVHGNIMINNKIIKNPSYNLKKDNILSFKKNIIINIKKKIINNLYSKN